MTNGRKLCQYPRSDLKPCYHDIWPNDGSHCVFHSDRPGKLKDFKSALHNFIFRIELPESQFDSYDFTEFKFPELKLNNKKFEKPVHFKGAIFDGEVELFKAQFQKEVVFDGAQFHEKVVLGGTSFYDETSFYATIFHKVASFHSSRIYGIFNFERINQIEGQTYPEYILDFRNVTIGQTARVRMATVNLKKALFLRTDLSNIQFFEAVWPDKREQLFSKRTILYDEVIYFEEKAKKTSHDDSIISWLSSGTLLNIEYLYRQLKKNYDDKTDYTAGGQFHIGEMEIKHKRATSNLIVKPAFWLFSPTVWYKRISMYGESYWRAAVCILLSLFIVTWLFMVSGLSSPGNCLNPEINYGFANHIPLLEKQFWVDTLKASKHTLSIFYFSRFQYLEACGSSGPYLNILGYLVSLALHALFLLALRRRFKR